jgi:hypothetical protein
LVDNAFEHTRLAAIFDALEADRGDLDVYVGIAEELGARSVLDVGCGTGTFAAVLPRLQVDRATMTGNVAQAIVERADWEATLSRVYDALRPGGYLVFETRDPAYQAWQGWNREASYSVTEIDGIGAVESWHEVTDVSGPLVSFRSTTVFASDGESVTSDSTLRFRERDEIEADLVANGYVLDDVRDAPDRTGRELVFFARAGTNRADAPPRWVGLIVG